MPSVVAAGMAFFIAAQISPFGGLTMRRPGSVAAMYALPQPAVVKALKGNPHLGPEGHMLNPHSFHHPVLTPHY